MPSDHVIADCASFFAGLDLARPWAERGKLITFGITAHAPETGYGYIQCGEVLEDTIFAVAQFTEKPSRTMAQGCLESGGYVSNSGIFLFTTERILHEMAQHSPAILAAASTAFAARTQAEHFIRPERAAMESCPSLSIDYAVMEHTKNAAVMPLDMGWCDLGSWASLHAISEKDATGNTVYSNVIMQETTNCHIRSNRPLIAAIGLNDLIVVAADNAVLIASHDKIGEIKTLMRSMVAQGIPDTRLTSFSHRPWGSFYGIDQGERYQVKRLVLKPGGKISLQTHAKRAEHWVVVKSTATVTNGETLMRLSANESTYIPAGTLHRLENRDDDDLIVIEVQTGAYLGEDDIERYDDMYQRT